MPFDNKLKKTLEKVLKNKKIVLKIPKIDCTDNTWATYCEQGKVQKTNVLCAWTIKSNQLPVGFVVTIFLGSIVVGCFDFSIFFVICLVCSLKTSIKKYKYTLISSICVIIDIKNKYFDMR